MVLEVTVDRLIADVSYRLGVLYKAYDSTAPHL
jgi:hypothetical protein